MVLFDYDKHQDVCAQFVLHHHRAELMLHLFHHPGFQSMLEPVALVN